MYCHKLTVVVAVALLSLFGLVRSQRDHVFKRVWQNGPTGISIEAGRQRVAQGPPPGFRGGPVINGPTAFSVEASRLEQQSGGAPEFEDVDLEALDDDGETRYIEDDVDLGDIDNDDVPRKFVNGHTGSSVHFAEAKAGNRGVISTDPKQDKSKNQLPKGLHVQTTDWSKDSAQWSFKGSDWALVLLPDAQNHPNLPAPLVPSPALVVITKEPLSKAEASRDLEGLENVTLHFSYFLSEGESGSIPELKVYQVKDETHTAQVIEAMKRGVWSEASASLPYGGSSKIVFVAQQKKTGNEIAIDDITISGVSTGTSNPVKKIMKPDKKAGVAGKEAKVATTGKSVKDSSPTEGVTGVTTGQGNEDEGTVTPGTVSEGNGKPQETGNVTKKTPEVDGKGTEATLIAAGEETEETSTTAGEGTEKTPEASSETVKGTEKPQEAGQVTKNPEETDLTTINANMTAQGNDTDNMVEGTGLPQQANETYRTGVPEITGEVNETIISKTTEVPLQNNGTFNASESPHLMPAQGEETTVGDDRNSTEFVNVTMISVLNGSKPTEGEVITIGTNENSTEFVNFNVTMVFVPDGSSDNATEGPWVNQTGLANVTTDVEVSGEVNRTEITIMTSALPTNMTENISYDIPNNNTNSPLATTLNPEIANTETSVSVTQTGPEVTPINANLTDIPSYNATGDGNVTTSINLTLVQSTSDISNPAMITTLDQGSSNSGATTTSLIMTNSTSPSGVNSTSPLGLGIGTGNGTTPSGGGDDGSSSWNTFRVFLVICLLGVAVMGFLYWRRQRRRDDEIPVFSRASHADYHNPTFSDDDSNFASRGTGHNYKSFN